MVHAFVLVHGAWHGGWCWRRVADRLRRGGHVVFTPTLTGLGERAHLLAPGIDLATHVADVVNLLKWERLSEVILCGHSYGGFVTFAPLCNATSSACGRGRRKRSASMRPIANGSTIFACRSRSVVDNWQNSMNNNPH